MRMLKRRILRKENVAFIISQLGLCVLSFPLFLTEPSQENLRYSTSNYKRGLSLEVETRLFSANSEGGQGGRGRREVQIETKPSTD